LQTRRKIVTTKNSDQHSKRSGIEREKEDEEEKKMTQSQEERVQEEEKGEIANAKEEERQPAKVMRRVAGTDAPYIDRLSDKAPRS
jgi:hypothetical protein